MSDAGTSELEARIAKLEAENAALRSEAVTAKIEGTDAAGAPPRERRRRGRTVAAVVLVVVALLLAPVAVISAWARIQLVDTEQFVATFAPLAEEPAVQSYIGDQVTAAIEEQVDIPTLTSDLFDGIKQLDLPPRAEQALGLLEAPATQGLQSLVSGIVDRVVESPAFADMWATALRASHRAFVAAVQGDPDAALAIGGDGTISVQLGPIIETVKDRLVRAGGRLRRQHPGDRANHRHRPERRVRARADDLHARRRRGHLAAVGLPRAARGRRVRREAPHRGARLDGVRDSR